MTIENRVAYDVVQWSDDPNAWAVRCNIEGRYNQPIGKYDSRPLAQAEADRRILKEKDFF